MVNENKPKESTENTESKLPSKEEAHYQKYLEKNPGDSRQQFLAKRSAFNSKYAKKIGNQVFSPEGVVIQRPGNIDELKETFSNNKED